MTATSCSEAGDTTAPGMGELYALHRAYSSQSGSVEAVIKAELDNFGLSSLFSEERAASDAAYPEEAMGVNSRRGVFRGCIQILKFVSFIFSPRASMAAIYFPAGLLMILQLERPSPYPAVKPLIVASATIICKKVSKLTSARRGVSQGR